MSFVVGFILGAAAMWTAVYFAGHPDDRAALFARIKGLFKRG